MNDAKNTDLRELAEAAVPGPFFDPWPDEDELMNEDGCGFLPARAAYVAALHPNAILALLDERDRLRDALGDTT